MTIDLDSTICETSFINMGEDRANMGEDRAGPGETAGWPGQGRLGSGFLFQGLHQDAFQAADVDEVNLQGSLAGSVETLRRVALSQPEQLVPLPDPGPGQRAFEETLGELVHRRPQLGRLALDVIRRPGGVPGDRGGIIVGVGGPAAFGLALVDLDQPAPVVDAHQLAVQPDLHLLPRRAGGGRHRVEGQLALDVMVRMHFDGAPVGDLVGHAVPGEQGMTPLLLEDHQRLPAGGAVDAPAGDLETPLGRFGSEVGQPRRSWRP